MTHNTREIDERQIRSDWQEFWYKESKNTEQSYLTPDTHGIVIDYLKELHKTHHQELQKAREELLEEMNAFTFEACPYEGTMMRAFIRSKQSELDQPK